MSISGEISTVHPRGNVNVSVPSSSFGDEDEE